MTIPYIIKHNTGIKMVDDKQDMRKYMDDTHTLVKQGKYAEALERMIWFHNHALEHDPAMCGVRLSFALLYWNELGKVYPPALEALIKDRDDKTALLESGKDECLFFADVAAINRELKEDSKTIELFRKLDKDHPALAERCWIFARRNVMEAKDYALARKYSKDIASELGMIITLHQEVAKNNSYDADYKRWSDNDFVEKTLVLIHRALEIEDFDAAREIQAKALIVLNDDRIRNAVPESSNEHIV